MEYPGSGAAAGSVPTYVVSPRDTVDSIAQRYGVSPRTIIERNKLQEPYRIQPGQTLEVCYRLRTRRTRLRVGAAA